MKKGDNSVRVSAMSNMALIATFAIVVAGFACKFNSSTLTMEKVGFEITFPCKYKASQASFSCRIDKHEEFTVHFVAPPVTQYETRKAIYEGYADTAAEKGDEGKLVERQIDGFKTLDYTETRFEAGDRSKPIERKRYLDLYKDGNLFEISGSTRRDHGTDPAEFEKKIKDNFDPFFESIKLSK